MVRFVFSRRVCGTVLAAALVAAQSPAEAQTGNTQTSNTRTGNPEAQAEEAVAAPRVAALAREGYGDIKVEWTWLGRLRIVAWLDGQRREIILHPTTGEVLRDLSTPPATAYAQGDDSSGTQAGPVLRSGTATASAIGSDDGATLTLTLDDNDDDIFTGDPAVSAIGTGVAP